MSQAGSDAAHSEADVTKTPGPSGTIRILTLFDIPVYLHWSWGVVFVFLIQYRITEYGGSMFWVAIEYIGLFALVLMHEFGHALACRSVGGTVSHVLLWPLGGIAHVRPPQRPGALLWSIVAGPLVNLVIGLASLIALVSVWTLLPGVWQNLEMVLGTLAILNVVLFVFNMLPIHPLDGGQIVRALLWYVIGRERSLIWTSAAGLVAAGVGGLAALYFLNSYWIPLIAAYAMWRSYQSLRAANAMQVLMSLPRRTDAHCPSCSESPPIGAFWICPNEHRFDAFDENGICPGCNQQLTDSPCIMCMETSPIDDYFTERADP